MPFLPSLFPTFMRAGIGSGTAQIVTELVLELDAVPDIEIDTTPVEVTLDAPVEINKDEDVVIEVD
jgi:hypothetical protein